MVPVFLIFIGFGSGIFQKAFAVPPDACFAKFRNDDCGQPPKAVMYYYKPGSRCEVGFWRGCLPNLNMFADEYECVRTCIFVDRVRDDDYHNNNKEEESALVEDVTEHDNETATTDTNTGETGNTDAGSDVTGTDSGASAPTTDTPEPSA